MKDKKESSGDLLQGTLDLLILKALAKGSMHGYGVAEWIHESSQDVLRVEEGALYPALHRLELRGLLSSEWGTSDFVPPQSTRISSRGDCCRRCPNRKTRARAAPTGAELDTAHPLPLEVRPARTRESIRRRRSRASIPLPGL